MPGMGSVDPYAQAACRRYGTLVCVTRPSKRSDAHAAGRSSSQQDGSNPTSHRRKRKAEPLAASWQPVIESDDEDEPRPGRRRRRRGYGWRVYAVPLLIVVSALTVFQVIDPSSTTPANGSDGSLFSSPSKEPVVTESPGQKYDPEISSAELPIGGDFPVSGSRTFQVLPGSSEQVGSGTLYTYTVEAEVGAELTEGNETFSRLVQKTLSDPRSWTNPAGGGLAVQRIDDPATTPDFRVTLTSQQTTRELCDFGGGLPFDTSCRIQDRVYINAARWVRGAVAFDGDIGSYRRYAINHEVGHVLDNGHTGCDRQGGLAPVMMQQTLSTSNNELNKLNETVSQGTPIPANGFVCKYNAWPFPAPSKPVPGS